MAYQPGRIKVEFNLPSDSMAVKRMLENAERLDTSIHQICKQACLAMYSDSPATPPMMPVMPMAVAQTPPAKEKPGEEIAPSNLLDNGAVDVDF